MSNEMQAAIDAFVSEVKSIIRKDVLRSLDAGPKATGHVSAARHVTGAAGQKRDPKVLAETVQRVAEFIKAHPGLTIEQIGPGVNHTTAELVLPIKKLLDAKIITRKGHKRSTKYFPARVAAKV